MFAEKTNSRSLWFHLMFNRLTAQLFLQFRFSVFSFSLLLKIQSAVAAFMHSAAAASSHLNKPFFCWTGIMYVQICSSPRALWWGSSIWVWAVFNRLISHSKSLSNTVCLWLHCIIFPLTPTERIAGMYLHSHRLYFSVCVSFAWMHAVAVYVNI